MKMLLLAGLFVTFNAFAVEYSCECYDTGLECDGQERMSVKLSARKVFLQTTDKDGDFPTDYRAVYDPSYKPRTNKDMVRFININEEESDYPYFLLTKSMLKGEEVGLIKAPSYGHVWEFECTLTK